MPLGITPACGTFRWLRWPGYIGPCDVGTCVPLTSDDSQVCHCSGTSGNPEGCKLLCEALASSKHSRDFYKSPNKLKFSVTCGPQFLLSIYIPTYFDVLSETSVMAPMPFWNVIYPPCLFSPSEEKSDKTCRKKKIIKQVQFWSQKQM